MNTEYKKPIGRPRGRLSSSKPISLTDVQWSYIEATRGTTSRSGYVSGLIQLAIEGNNKQRVRK